MCIIWGKSHTQVSATSTRPRIFLWKNSSQINLFTCELDISDTHLTYFTIVQYKLRLPPQGKKISLNLIGDGDFTITNKVGTLKNISMVINSQIRQRRIYGYYKWPSRNQIHINEPLRISNFTNAINKNKKSRPVYVKENILNTLI